MALYHTVNGSPVAVNNIVIDGAETQETVTGNNTLSLPNAKANSLTSVVLDGATEQGVLPSAYQLYTSVEAGGVTYEYSSTNLTQIPCKRISDNVFGLYNYTTGTFISEI